MRLTTAELVGWLIAEASKEPETVNELATRYMYLVALQFKDPREYLPLLSSIPSDNLEWCDEIKEMFRSSAMGTEYKNVTVPPRVFSSVLKKADDSSITHSPATIIITGV